MNAVRPSAVLAVALCAASLFAQTEEKHLLRFAFETGRVNHYRQTMAMRQKVKMGDREMATALDTGVTFKTEVKGFADGKATVENTFVRVTMKMDNPMMKVDYDSDDPDSRPGPGPMAMMEDLVGESITAHVDERGHFSDVSTSDGFPDGAFEMFGGDLSQFLSRSVPEMPDQPIAVGGNWDTAIEMPMGQAGTTKAQVHNTLLKVEGGRARIAQKIAVDTDGMQMPGGAKMNFDKCEGYTVIDLATGSPVESRMETHATMGEMMDMTMTIEIATVPPPPPATAKDAAAGKGDQHK